MNASELAVGLPTATEPEPRLRDTQFGWLWLNAVSFTLISTAERFTFVWLVIEVLNGPGWASGGILFALGLPVFLLVLPAGAIADRYDRRRLLLITQLAGALITLLSAVLLWTDQMTLPIAFGPAIALGCAMAFGMPVRSSLVSAVVPRPLLMKAIAANTVGMNIAMIVGPVIGGFAVRNWGIAAAFAIESGLFALGFASLWALRIPAHVIDASKNQRPSGARATAKSLLSSIGDGLRFVWSVPSLRSLFALLLAGGFLMMGSAAALLPRIARDEFGKDADQASALFAFMGAGMTCTSVYLLTRRQVKRRGLLFLVAMSSGTTCHFVMGFAPSYLVLAGLLVWWGASGGFYANLNQTLIQSATPLDMMGRVMSLAVLANAGVAPLGSLLAGTVADSRLGPQTTFGLFGLVGMCTVATAWVFARSLRAIP